jgi:hypothetical protein
MEIVFAIGREPFQIGADSFPIQLQILRFEALNRPLNDLIGDLKALHDKLVARS